MQDEKTDKKPVARHCIGKIVASVEEVFLLL